MAESSKRNLLYGMFAWRMGYIDRQQLSKALQESADSEIGSVLVDLGIINEQSRAEIDRLLLDQINRHNGDEEASLASLRHDKETTNEFKDETPANLSLPLDNTDNPVFPLQPITTEVSRGEFHAKGGLGRIYRSTDVSLQREVAVKQIDERFADVDEAQERFRREAMVTSQLQHPGVVPVYGLGVDQSGRPYYTMRFVEGVHFGEKISQFHSPAIDYRSVEFLELLDCVVDAAQTVRYAHSKGIVHRDLKPANILVGKFGETVVIDWGLAKILSEPGHEIFVGEIECGEGTR